MAQLALTLAGGWAGGALAGGIGRAFGSLVGGYLGAIVEQELFGPEHDPHEAAKSGQVSDIRISGSAYGQMIPRVWGRARLPANIIWLRGIKEKAIVTTEEVGGAEKAEAKARPSRTRPSATMPISPWGSARARSPRFIASGSTTRRSTPSMLRHSAFTTGGSPGPRLADPVGEGR